MGIKFFSAPLPAAGVLDGVKTRRGEGHPLRGCLRDSASKSIRRQIAILLLAVLQSESLRSQGGSDEIREYVIFTLPKQFRD